MKSIVLSIFCLSFLADIKSYGQQLDLNEVIQLTTAHTVFEKKMIELGNYPVKIEEWCTSIWRTADSYDFIEKGFYINHSSESKRDCSDSLKIDSSHVAFTRQKHRWSYFSEKYDKEAKTGFTHYYWISLELDVLKGEEGVGVDHRFRRTIPGVELIIDYAREQDYLNLVKEISDVAVYLETKEKYFDNENLTCRHIYFYNGITIEVQRNDKGGVIHFLTKKV